MELTGDLADSDWTGATILSTLDAARKVHVNASIYGIPVTITLHKNTCQGCTHTCEVYRMAAPMPIRRGAFTVTYDRTADAMQQLLDMARRDLEQFATDEWSSTPRT